MTDKLYRCGYCGSPTDELGEPIHYTKIDQSKDWDSAELTHGLCCAFNFDPKYREITREMAMDAGLPEIEGMMIRES